MYQIQLYTIDGEARGYEADLSLNDAKRKAREVLEEVAKQLPTNILPIVVPSMTRYAEILNQDTGDSVSAYKLTNALEIHQISLEELPEKV